MNRCKSGFLLPGSVILMIAISCAKISAPTGGPRDNKPPVIIKSIPLNGARNFSGKNIAITFDEYVTLDNINDKFMVSPPMKKKPRVFLKGKSVNVEFEDKLKDSTTYTFYFQDAIRDLNEGNILKNFQFVFSTGPVIDSLSVTGNVYNALKLEVPEKTQVLLYRELEDSAVNKHLPEYISRVDDYGYFRINNVRGGKYRLFALKDDDNSKNYNRIEEEFAFMDSLIVVTSEKNFMPVKKDTAALINEPKKEPLKSSEKVTKKSEPPAKAKETKKEAEPVIEKGEYQLITFLAAKKEHYLTNSSRDSKYLLSYSLSLPPDTFKFDFSIQDNGSEKYFIERSTKRDSLKVWITDSTLYSLPLISTILKYPFTDTLGVVGYKQDTIPMRFTTPRLPKGAKVKKAPFTYQSNMSGGSLKPGESIVFRSETPLREPDTSRIRFFEIVEKKRARIHYQFLKDTVNSRKYVLTANLAPGKSYLFIADSAAMGNIFSENADSAGTKFLVRDAESYSKLIINIQNCEGNKIIQLLNSDEKLVAQKKVNKDGKIEFSLLDPAFYRLRAISDINGDGLWTTGDFTTHRQPEAVTYYPTELEIRKGYILDQDWNVNMINYKEQKLRVNTKKR